MKEDLGLTVVLRAGDSDSDRPAEVVRATVDEFEAEVVVV